MSIDFEREATALLGSAIRKLKAGMDSGPFGPPVMLEPNEATILYRTFEIKLPALTRL